MFLKSLSMKGFKSFADPTVLEFQPGITVVVGPNGSGKSNVVDAVTWVLGAQGPRSLRSATMEDVIFAGTASRPALGRAEVSLTIDNRPGRDGSARLAIDTAEVTITRTLFRSGDSEYAINGAPCRLLDIQDLLSDSGVGRTRHMIIGQGQLDTVLNARPEDRRAIIEEAAGVLKHRRRRERAERRLAVTQENLERLGDLVREVRRQIRPLERQATAARSHATLAAELLTLRRYVAGVELAELAERTTRTAADLAQLANEDQALQSTLQSLDAAAAATTAELSSRREEDLATTLGQVQGLVERARGTNGVLRERSRALVAALDAAADVDVVSTLEAEGARLDGELAGADTEVAAMAPERQALTAAEVQLAADQASHQANWGDGSEPADAEEAVRVARSRTELLTRAQEHERQVLDELDRRMEGMATRAAALQGTVDQVTEREAELEQTATKLAAAATATEQASLGAAEMAEQAQQAADEAERSRHRTAARAEALSRALRELQGAGGREALAGIDGVVGALVDLVEIDPGWEKAFEAAAGASVAAVVVDGRDAARQALARLYRQGTTGALLAALPESRSAALANLPDDVEPLRPHVRARAGAPGAARIEGVLDALTAGATRVAGWERAIDIALDRPDLVVVTEDGDRFAPSGWRVRSGREVVTAVAVDEAIEAAERAAVEADTRAQQLGAARQAYDAARDQARVAARAVDQHEAVRAAALAEARRDRTELERVTAELAEATAAHRAARERDDAAGRELAEAQRVLPALDAAVIRTRERAMAAAAARKVLDDRAAELATQARDLQVRSAELAERHRVLRERRREVERRLEGHAEEREQAAARRQRLEADGRVLTRLEALVEGVAERLEQALEVARVDYQAQVEAVRASGARLEALQRERVATEHRLTQVAERARILDRRAAEASLRTEALVDLVRRELGREPSELADATCPELPEGVTPDDRVNDLTERLAKMGPVNPLALDELAELEERHRDLESQVDDVRSARRELQEVIRTVDDEIMQSFAAAAADVNEHFSALVAMLFPGGTGRLILTDPDDLLRTGVEVEVRPVGRNVRRVSLLSGGERSLAALAFLFAVFRSRPSPFYLMDEVEAALDDVNLHRFLGLVKNFRDEAQLIIVSHQKRTMEAGDALYGVTMAPGGSSKVVSQKVEPKAEPRAEPEPAAS